MRVNPFIASAFPARAVVLRQVLRPFSAYHWAALIALRSPYIGGGQVAASDLIAAVWVCTHGWGDNVLDVDEAAVKAWGHAHDFESESAAFQAYLSAFLDFPERYEFDDDRGKETAIPLPFFCVASVMRSYPGILEAEAWDMPLNRLVAYRRAKEEADGAVLVSDRDLELAEVASNG